MRLAALLGAMLVLAACGGTRTQTVIVTRTRPAVTVTTTATTQTPPQTAPGAQNSTYFGRVVSVTQVDAKRYLLVLEPQFFLVGITANDAFAAAQGTHCAPLSCPGVTDDRYVVGAGSRRLTFVLPAATSGTVLTLSGQQMQPTTVSAAQFAALVAGGQTPKLVEPLESGVWLSVDVDKVTSFAQQFQP